METLVLPTVRTQDKQALVGIYQQHSPELYRYAYRLLGDSEMAEDCVAETFSRLLQAVRHDKGPEANTRAWLYRVAHNWITDHYRRQPPAPLSLEADMHADPDGNPSQVVARELERERVRAALMKLPSDQRQVVELRFLENWPHEAVAAALGKTPEATRALQYRALASLKRLLSEHEEI